MNSKNIPQSDTEYQLGTIGYALADFLYGFAIFPGDIKAILNRAVEMAKRGEITLTQLDERINDQESDYEGVPVVQAYQLSVQQVAIEWFEENKPEAWMLPLLRA